MIVTVTFNPSLDYIVTVPDFATGKTNRTSSELMLPGGKGINVSIVLSNLGVENTALYFAAGFLAGWEEAERADTEATAVHAFQMGVAAGSASAFSKYLATKEEILEVYRRMQEEGGRA